MTYHPLDSCLKVRGYSQILLLITFIAVFVNQGCIDKCSSRPIHNVILISIDSLRADHVGSYGYPKPATPALDEFARQGIRFENSYASSPWTLPTHASMFTGLTPTTHGVVKFKSTLKPGAQTLATILQRNGYKTVAVVCAPLLKKRYGLHQGFDIYDTELIPPEYAEALLSKVASKVTEKALNYIDGNRRTPFFLFLHYWDPHYDYNPSTEYASMFDPDYQGTINGLNIRYRKDLKPDMNRRDLQHIISLYDGEIRYTDDQIKRLLVGLEKRGLNSNTMVIITSDHGEEFLEHGWKGHTNTCYEELIKIPLLLKIPWIESVVSVVDDYVSTVDILPTILAALEIKLDDATTQGVSLLETFTHGTKLSRAFLTAETRYGHTAPPLKKVGPWKVLIAPGKYKYHYYGNKSKGYKALLFNLQNDSQELKDLSDDQADLVHHYHEILSDEITRQKRLKREKELSSSEKLDARTKEMLQGLGYIQ